MVVAFCSPEQGCGVCGGGCEEDAGGLLGGKIAMFGTDVGKLGGRVGRGGERISWKTSFRPPMDENARPFPFVSNVGPLTPTFAACIWRWPTKDGLGFTVGHIFTPQFMRLKLQSALVCRQSSQLIGVVVSPLHQIGWQDDSPEHVLQIYQIVGQ